MSVAFALTSGAGVLEVARNAMGPAIADRYPINDGLAHSWWERWVCAVSLNSIGGAVGVGGPGVDKGLLDNAAQIVGSNARVG